jgi:RNA polymerase sigma-70 factor (ECF subfamily)
MNDAETAELVTRAARGDDDAFRALVRSHHAVLYRWALVIADDGDDAEDLMQAVWIKVHRSIADYRGDAKFSSWLYRITANTAIESGRRRQRRVVALQRIHQGGMAIEPEADDVSDASLQLAVQVRTFLAELSPRQREVFALADLDERSTSEIAEMLEIAESTVRVTLMKARRVIRTRLMREQPLLVEELLS